jgi:hypothetical protein
MAVTVGLGRARLLRGKGEQACPKEGVLGLSKTGRGGGLQPTRIVLTLYDLAMNFTIKVFMRWRNWSSMKEPIYRRFLRLGYPTATRRRPQWIIRA